MPAAEFDHYAILGLDRRCTLEQIRRAYRLLSKRYHPDLNPGSTEAVERCREVNAAYEVLSDDARRRAYDRELEQTSAAEPRAPRVAKADRNIAQDTFLKFGDFLHGTTLEVRVNDPGNPTGPEIYEVTVPAGTAPGTRIRLPRHAPFDDGHVQIRVKLMPGARFKARGSDLKGDLRINARRAADGGTEMTVGPTGGPLRVQIPRGIARGETVRIPGEGLPKPRGGRGDLLLRVIYRPEVRVARKSGGF